MEEKIVPDIQTYVDMKLHHFKQQMVTDHLKKQEHLVQCLMFKSVYVIDKIYGINVHVPGHMCHDECLTFYFLNVFDWNGETVFFKINSPLKYDD